MNYFIYKLKRFFTIDLKSYFEFFVILLAFGMKIITKREYRNELIKFRKKKK